MLTVKIDIFVTAPFQVCNFISSEDIKLKFCYVGHALRCVGYKNVELKHVLLCLAFADLVTYCDWIRKFTFQECIYYAGIFLGIIVGKMNWGIFRNNRMISE